ncbi:YceI family protein [Magnetospira sp. QH-2]|uniref:YceI family protein n=1 Tax=Magnetospira sp. (strain QH-2) TaxID=1288970 RepID=UPI0003E81390|nr:YceI family protein [Magnetospira sp. QH-2]CCQ72403.1 polyprenyl-pyrophosphate binding protein [Magnetospira sp. QH-2]
MTKTFLRAALVALPLAFAALAPSAQADSYVIDTKGAHASINFKIKHLGISWLTGRFNSFQGTFNLDEANPGDAKVHVTIDTASIDSNHAERDKHLRGGDFLDVDKFPKATFVSRKVEVTGKDTAKVTGDFTLHGVTKPLTLDVTHTAAGTDPWGGFRRGFEGKASFALADYGIDFNLGPASKEVQITLYMEGIRQ